MLITFSFSQGAVNLSVPILPLSFAMPPSAVFAKDCQIILFSGKTMNKYAIRSAALLMSPSEVLS